ncbi:hypothetical protein RclHR1_15950001, partial [Rhizophagus clarus]
ENSFVQAQGFAFQRFQQQQNWNLYNQLTIDPFIIETNNNLLNAFAPIDQDSIQYNFQQNLGFNVKKDSNHIYSKYTIPSITSIISQHVTTNNINTMNFLPLSTSNNIITQTPSSEIKPSIGIDFNYNENENLLTQSNTNLLTQSNTNLLTQSNTNLLTQSNTNLLTQSNTNLLTQSNTNLLTQSDTNLLTQSNSNLLTQSNTNLLTQSNVNLLTQSQPQPQDSIQSSDTLSYFATPDNDTTISIQDILDGMKVMQEISNDLTNYNSNLDNNLLLQDITNITNFDDENSIDWLIQENWKDMSKQDEIFDLKGKLPEKKQDDIFCQDVEDLIEEHMKEIKKVVHNEILCQEILTESLSLEYQDFKIVGINQTEDSNISSTSSTSSTATTSITRTYSQDIIIKQEVISQETVAESSSSSSSSNIFVPQEINFSHGMLTNSTNLMTTNQRTLKCNEIGCSKEYNCYAKLKSHKVTAHTNDKPFMCNVLGCNKKFKRSGELLKHQSDHLN